jgi:hypothetical protein
MVGLLSIFLTYAAFIEYIRPSADRLLVRILGVLLGLAGIVAGFYCLIVAMFGTRERVAKTLRASFAK